MVGERKGNTFSLRKEIEYEWIGYNGKQLEKVSFFTVYGPKFIGFLKFNHKAGKAQFDAPNFSICFSGANLNEVRIKILEVLVKHELILKRRDIKERISR